MKNDFKKHFKLFNNLNVYFWIGGACIYDFFNAQKPTDIDVFFKSEKDVNKAISILKKRGFKLILKRNIGALFESREGVRYDLLCLTKNPEHLFHNFNDFTVCCAAVDSDGFFWHHEDYFEHCDNKKLHYIEKRMTNDLNKQKRLKKYLHKGFSMNNQNLLKWIEKLESDRKKCRNEGIKINVKQVFFEKLENLKFNIIKTKIKD
jgi:hypothetical protein